LGRVLEGSIALFATIPLVLIIPIVFLLARVLTTFKITKHPAIEPITVALEIRMARLLNNSYLLVSSPWRTDTPLRQVRKELEELELTCNSIAILATAEGAALVHRLLAEYQPKSLRRFITIGSAVRPVAIAKRLSSLRLTWLGFVFSGGLLIFGIWEITQLAPWIWATVQRLWRLVFTEYHSFIFYYTRAIAQLGQRTTSSNLGPILFSPLRDELQREGIVPQPVKSPYFLASMAAMFLSTRRAAHKGLDKPLEPELRLALLNSKFRWIDYYASADIVPAGPLTPQVQPWIDCRQVVNAGSVLRDHKSYFRNRDEFIPSLARELGLACEPPFAVVKNTQGVFLEAVALRRRRRIANMRWTRRTAVLVWAATIPTVLGRVRSISNAVIIPSVNRWRLAAALRFGAKTASSRMLVYRFLVPYAVVLILGLIMIVIVRLIEVGRDNAAYRRLLRSAQSTQ
jgi:hypothetical protein